MLFDQSDVRNICTDCCGQSEQTTATYTENCFLPDALLPYGSAGNAVLPHRIPRGSDITGGI